MAVTTFSPLLGLALPTTGDLSGTWGTTVNDAITSLLDSAVAGTTTLSADADVTLTTTNGVANQARNAVILWTASNGATTRNVTAPAQSKAYVVINAGTGSVVIRGTGPTTGVTVISGEKCLVAWNGSDFVRVSSTSITNLTGVLPTANGGTNLSTFTAANNALYSTSSSVLVAGTRLATLTTANNALYSTSSSAMTAGTLPVAAGGTGATTAANALSNLNGVTPGKAIALALVFGF